MVYPAFDAKEVTGSVLLKDRALMELWKRASDEGLVQAVTVEGQNYVVVKDEGLAKKVTASAKGLKSYRYDEERKTLT